jgi:1-acyl-sn-glycerol-3-phosphate acyltransferase
MSRRDDPMTVFHFSPWFHIASFAVYHAVLLLVILFDWLVFGVGVKGKKNLAAKKAVLVSNHTLYLDPGILSHALAPRRAYYSAMESTFRVPFLGTFIRLLGAFPLTNRDPLVHIAKQLKRAIRSRGFIHVFAEGEMTHKNQRVKSFKDGAFFLAFVLGVPVIPIAIAHRPRRLLGRNLPWLPLKVTVVIEPPLQTRDFEKPGASRREAMTAMRDKTREIIQEALDREGR